MLMIPGIQGCETLNLNPAVDVAAERCVPLDPRDEREFSKWAPHPDKPNQDLTSDDMKDWVNRLEVSESKKNKAGKRLINDYKACSGLTKTS